LREYYTSHSSRYKHYDDREKISIRNEVREENNYDLKKHTHI
jgi:hypothetical protein